MYDILIISFNSFFNNLFSYLLFTQLLNNIEYIPEKNKYENILLKKQLKDIINISYICKYFNNIIKKYCFKVLYIQKKINVSIIKKYKSKYLIMPNDNKLNDNQLKSLTNITYINLYINKNITDKGLEPLTNLTSLYLDRNKNITDSATRSRSHPVSTNDRASLSRLHNA